MSTYYLLPGNWNFGPVQTIPVDPANKIHQNASGVNAATKIQNLNTVLVDDAAELPLEANITTTVASVLAPNPAYDPLNPDPSILAKIPAYQVNVHGWTDGAVEVAGTLSVAGGFPRSFTNAQNVDPAQPSAVLPEGTLTVYPTPTIGSPITPEVYLLMGTPVSITDLPTDTIPMWSVTLDTPYLTQEAVLEFNFSFHLYIQ